MAPTKRTAQFEVYQENLPVYLAHIEMPLPRKGEVEAISFVKKGRKIKKFSQLVDVSQLKKVAKKFKRVFSNELKKDLISKPVKDKYTNGHSDSLDKAFTNQRFAHLALAQRAENVILLDTTEFKSSAAILGLLPKCTVHVPMLAAVKSPSAQVRVFNGSLEELLKSVYERQVSQLQPRKVVPYFDFTGKLTTTALPVLKYFIQCFARHLLKFAVTVCVTYESLETVAGYPAWFLEHHWSPLYGLRFSYEKPYRNKGSRMLYLEMEIFLK